MARYKMNDQGLSISEKQHDDFLDYVNKLLMRSKEIRDFQCERFSRIDKELYGYLVPDEDDRKRQRDNVLGHGVKPVDSKLPLTLSQLEEAVTYLLLVLAPDEGIYSAIAKRKDQSVASAFSSLMNKHAEYYGHYAQLGIYLMNALKYNYAGMLCEWNQVFGNVIDGSTPGGARPNISRNTLVQAGNLLTATDPYNTIYDSTVTPLNLYRDGEFIAFIDIKSKFWLKRAEKRNEIFNLDKLKSGSSLKWYEQRPSIDYQTGRDSINLAAPWHGLFSNETKYSDEIQERIVLYMQLYPKDWGLSTSTDLEVWRLDLLEGNTIIRAVQQTNAHGFLPHVITMPNEDGFLWSGKSWAQHLEPLNRFASFALNVTQRAARKALYNTIFYNQRIFGDLSDIDLTAAKVPMKSVVEGTDEDIRRHVFAISDVPDVNILIQFIREMRDFMEDMLPTKTQNQVASLERATQYQAAATVQSGNKRNLKTAKIINIQSLTTLKFMQMYNILQYQEQMEIIAPDGNVVEVRPAAFREAELEFAISDGLRGLDKLLLISTIKEILNVIVQSQQAIQYFDVPAIVNHWTSLIGDQTDFTQFRLESQFDALPPEQKEQAVQLLQQAAAQPTQGANQ